MYFSPISFKDTALLSLKITKKKLSGIFHLSGKKDYNYYQFAKMLAVKLGKNKKLVLPTTSKKKILIFYIRIKQRHLK